MVASLVVHGLLQAGLVAELVLVVNSGVSWHRFMTRVSVGRLELSEWKGFVRCKERGRGLLIRALGLFWIIISKTTTITLMHKQKSVSLVIVCNNEMQTTRTRKDDHTHARKDLRSVIYQWTFYEYNNSLNYGSWAELVIIRNG